MTGRIIDSIQGNVSPFTLTYSLWFSSPDLLSMTSVLTDGHCRVCTLQPLIRGRGRVLSDIFSPSTQIPL
jgi:hypothetical protein